MWPQTPESVATSQQVLPEDGLLDGRQPYTDVELALIDTGNRPYASPPYPSGSEGPLAFDLTSQPTIRLTIAYHVSPRRNRASIKEHGINPDYSQAWAYDAKQGKPYRWSWDALTYFIVGALAAHFLNYAAVMARPESGMRPITRSSSADLHRERRETR